MQLLNAFHSCYLHSIDCELKEAKYIRTIKPEVNRDESFCVSGRKICMLYLQGKTIPDVVYGIAGAKRSIAMLTLTQFHLKMETPGGRWGRQCLISQVTKGTSIRDWTNRSGRHPISRWISKILD